MAPELRKRKASAAVSEPAVETVETVTTKTVKKPKTAKAAKPKRQGDEITSPVSVKKQKSTKKTVTPTAVTETTVEIEADIEADTISIGGSDSDDDNVQALALRVDSEDEVAPDGETFTPGQDVGTVPEVTVTKGKPSGDAGVVYMGRIPHGFYENEMRQYFSQFGRINQLRLSRNKKTGASKHFAFIEFAEATTADIVAKTMNNYLLFGHILKCSVVPKDNVHADLFKGADKKFKIVPRGKIAELASQRPKTKEAWEKKFKRENSKRAKKADKLREMGIEVDLPKLTPIFKKAEAVEVKAVEAPAPEAEVVTVEEVVTEVKRTRKTRKAVA